MEFSFNSFIGCGPVAHPAEYANIINNIVAVYPYLEPISPSSSLNPRKRIQGITWATTWGFKYPPSAP